MDCNDLSPIEHVLSLLPSAKPNGKGWMVCCPAHEDRSPSLSINEGDDGRVLLKCFAGCATEAIVEALGISQRDLFAERSSPSNGKARGSATKPTAKPASNGKAKRDDKPKGKSFATASAAVAALCRLMKPTHGLPRGQWTYHDAAGKPIAFVLRFNLPDGSKEFRPVSIHDGGWFLNAPATPRPLYGLPEIPNTETVFVCEGEKTADATRSLGLVAVTSMNGSQSPDKTDWTPLAGKNVVILPDHDEPGRKYAETVTAILAKLSPAPTVKIVELPGLTDGDDLVAWIEAHGDAAESESLRQELERVVEACKSVTPPIESQQQCQRQRNSKTKLQTRGSVGVDTFRRFPVEALPDLVRSYVTAAAASLGCDESFVALPVLSMLAAAIGNTRRLLIKRGWTEPPIVRTLPVGNSGSCKSPAMDAALKPVRDRQNDAFRRHTDAMAQYRAAELEHSKALDAWKRDKKSGEAPSPPIEPVAERFHADDTTIESISGLLRDQPRGLLVARDELSGWIGGFDRYANGKGGDVSKWLEMFGGRSIVIDRKTGEPRTLFIPRASVCLTGGIQPETLKRCLLQSHVDNGLAARLLFAYPPSRPRRWTDAVVDEALDAEFAHIVDSLFSLQFGLSESGEQEPKLVTLSPDAKRRFQQFVNEHGAEHVELTDAQSAAWSKLEGYAARFALVLYLARATTGEVDETIVDLASLEAGITLSRWFGREAKRIYGMLSESENAKEQRELIDWIPRRDGKTTARDLQANNRKYREAGAAEAALNDLKEADLGYWQTTQPTSSGGRPGMVFYVSVSGTAELQIENRGFADADTGDALMIQPSVA